MNRHMDQTWKAAEASLYPAPAACEFIGRDEFLALASSVYGDAAMEIPSPDGEPWVSDGATWSNAESFFEALCHRMREGLCRRADLPESLTREGRGWWC